MKSPFRQSATIGEVYGPAMVIEDQAAADAYFDLIVAHLMTWGESKESAEKMARDNLAYVAGYHGDATRLRVERLFNCAHPFFGPIAKNGPPTDEEALRAGMILGKKLRKERER